jgi:hypothetical protein
LPIVDLSQCVLSAEFVTNCRVEPTSITERFDVDALIVDVLEAISASCLRNRDGETPADACLGLDGQGPQAPKNATNNVSRRLAVLSRERLKLEGPKSGMLRRAHGAPQAKGPVRRSWKDPESYASEVIPKNRAAANGAWFLKPRRVPLARNS